jgi:acetate kinase
LPEIPLVAAFETGFHQTIPARQRFYAIPRAWSDAFHIQRFGFHGASHRYIAGRVAALMHRTDLRIISCHLGGSSSLCAIRHGESIGTSMGMSPQTGLPQNNRVGDFDPYVVPLLMERTGQSQQHVLDALATQGGLLGLSGLSGDIRDLQQAAREGHAGARLALDVYTSEVRRYLGAFLLELAGVDALVFTGGIGENSAEIRAAVCDRLESFGIVLDNERNASARGETTVHQTHSPVHNWVMPTNEELVVARQARDLLKG